MNRLVLAAAGHAHALVLRALARQPLPGVEVVVVVVVVVSPEPLAPYSGMVPGWLTGRHRFDEIAIHFPPLAAAGGARWWQGEMHAMDPARRLWPHEVNCHRQGFPGGQGKPAPSGMHGDGLRRCRSSGSGWRHPGTVR